jgi:hypothetical protein
MLLTLKQEHAAQSVGITGKLNALAFSLKHKFPERNLQFTPETM